jgi:hypothetical protein
LRYIFHRLLFLSSFYPSRAYHRAVGVCSQLNGCVGYFLASFHQLRTRDYGLIVFTEIHEGAIEHEPSPAHFS